MGDGATARVTTALQVYRGRMHDGREVALKIQRPGVRDVLGLDWAVATLVSRSYQTLIGSPNDYGQVVDTVAKGVRNFEQFHIRHECIRFIYFFDWAQAVSTYTVQQSLAHLYERYPAVNGIPCEPPRHFAGSRVVGDAMSVPRRHGAVGMELDYYNEAANAEEFAVRHAFLPFVTSPGWIPELMGPPGSSRVLALKLGA